MEVPRNEKMLIPICVWRITKKPDAAKVSSVCNMSSNFADTVIPPFSGLKWAYAAMAGEYAFWVMTAGKVL